MKTNDVNQLLDVLSSSKYKGAIKGIKRGIEREALRIKEDGKIAQTPHPKRLGHPLTHTSITTDFSESLLEFITPVSEDPKETLSQLRDLQKFTLSNIDDEFLWPMSMPCFISNQQDIPIAQFGQSNIGKMKTLYREGLKNRYGSMMQAIAGVHFNISFADKLWDSLQCIAGDKREKQTFISEKYLGLIRNFKREMWLLSYLFGASPALCDSFLQGKKSDLPFKKVGNGSLYLEYGTALRLGDLGYTNSAQSSLKVTYNSLDEYIQGLRDAINCHSDIYSELDDYTADQPQQINKNILQIENEFYSPIRPKRNAKSAETPTHALERAGIEYVEIRALDVNPFVDTGISLEQIHFLDVFLTYCLLKPSLSLSCEEQRETQSNLEQVVNFGRDESLQLSRSKERISLQSWANDIFSDLKNVAKLFDTEYQSSEYSNTINSLSSWIKDSRLTFSGQIVEKLTEAHSDTGKLAINLAKNYKQEQLVSPFQIYTESELQAMATESIDLEKTIYAADDVNFKLFLDNYFSKA